MSDDKSRLEDTSMLHTVSDIDGSYSLLRMCWSETLRNGSAMSDNEVTE